MRLKPLLIISAFAAIALVISLAPTVTSAQDDLTPEMRARILRSVVGISQVVQGEIVGEVSGVVVAPSGLIVTSAAHVEGIDDFRIALFVGPDEPLVVQYQARLMMYRPELDVALLQIDRDTEGNAVFEQDLSLAVIPIAQRAPNVGQPVFLLNASADRREPVVASIRRVDMGQLKGISQPTLFGLNTEIEPALVGGLAVNREGAMVGIVTGGRSEEAALVTGPGVVPIDAIFAAFTGPDERETFAELNVLRPVDTPAPPATNVLVPGASTNYGSADLEEGFFPDPFRIRATVGGDTNAANLNVAGCQGYVDDQPDYRIGWQTGAGLLRLVFFGLDDTMLVVLDPAGNWLCNDNSWGTEHPTIELMDPLIGQYHIWIGTPSQGQRVQGVLYMTADQALTPDALERMANTTPTAAPGPQGEGLDYRLFPQYGTFEISSARRVDPATVRAVSGGPVDVSLLALGGNCRGYTGGAPDVRVQVREATAHVRFFFVADARNNDTVLIVNDPTGRWFCNDDWETGDLNPLVGFNNPGIGQYDIWIASFRSNEQVQGALYITTDNRRTPENP